MTDTISPWVVKLVSPEGLVIEDHLCPEFMQVSNYIKDIKSSAHYQGCAVQYWKVHEITL